MFLSIKGKYTHLLDQCFTTEGSFVSQETSAMFGDIFHGHNWGVEVLWASSRKGPWMMQRTVHPSFSLLKELSCPKYQ